MLHKRFHLALVAASALLLGQPVNPAVAGSFPDRVREFQPGAGAGFGQAYYPGNVLGAPNGNSNPATPNDSAADLLSLGDGGWIVLEFTNTQIVDEPGADLAVFENPVQPLGFVQQSFAETAVVSVSEDGTSWTVFPFDFIAPADGGSLQDMANYSGFAGVHPVFSSPANGISAFDPLVSGGDFFDLADAGLSRARFVRIRDTGTTGATETVDADGQIVDDPGNRLPGIGGAAGFDLDAIAAIHSAPIPQAAARKEWQLYE